MKSLIQTIKNKQILLASVVMFLIQLFIAGSIIFVLLADDEIYVAGTNSKTEGYIAIAVSTVIGFIISTIIYLFTLSRLRGIWAFSITIIPLVILIILSFIPTTAAILATPMVGTIIFLSVMMGYFIFGLANWLYFKIKNLYFSLTILAFWHFGTIVVYIADKIGYSDNSSVEEVISKVTSAWDIVTIGLMAGFIVLSAILMIIDSKILLSRWSKDMKKESKIGVKNLSVIGFLFTSALIITLIVAPAFWRLHWEQIERAEQERESQQQNQQQQQQNEFEQEQRQQPPNQFDRPSESPKNDGDQFNSGGRIESSVPLGDGNPIFAVNLGQGEPISAESIAIFTSNQTKIEDKREFLWRAEVFDKYNDFDGFTKHTGYKLNNYSFNKQQGYYFSGIDEKYSSNEILEQRYVIISIESEEVFSANRPIEISYETNLNVPYIFGFNNDSIITDERQPLVPGAKYFTRSEVFTGDESELTDVAARIGFTDDEQSPLYQFGLDYEIYSLAFKIIRDAKSDYEKVKAVENYLRENYTYKAADDDNSKVLRDSDIYDFLITTKEGDVTHFAFAMVMLLNELDIDSRIASGFYQGDFDPTIEGYVVRDNDFTFWVEVFFNGYGWIEFQPAGTSDEIQQERYNEGNFDKQLLPDQKQDISEDFDELNELEKELDKKREQWDQQNQAPKPTPTPFEIFPTPTPEPEQSENNFLKLLQAIWNVISKVWWLVCSVIILLAIVLPIILKQLKYAWRRGVFKERSDKVQIKQNFLLLQDVLIDFSDQIKLPETAYQFSQRFVNEFPIDKKDNALRDELYTFATIYNRAVFADSIKSDDKEVMDNLTSIIIKKYTLSKGWKSLFRWFNPAGLFNK